MDAMQTRISGQLLELLQKIPKAELHVHIEGTLEPELMFAIAKRNNITLPYSSIDALREAYTFDNLQSFLDLYFVGASVLHTKQDFFDVAWAYLQRAYADHVVRAEIFFDLQSHTMRGIAVATVIEGLYDACQYARAKLGISADLILCFLRHRSEQEALEALEAALPWRQCFIGIGLASTEVGHPPEKFARVFAYGAKRGLHLVAHAGEECGPECIWGVLDKLHVERIDHGVQAVHDETLMQRLVDQQIPITLCPISNLKIHVLDKLSQDNVGKLLKCGVCVTINSDDPAYFGGYINDNYVTLCESLGLGCDDACALASNSIKASFAPECDKQQWMQELKSVCKMYCYKHE